MQPLTVADIRPPAVYEPVRADARRRVIELKRERRVLLGDLLSLVFENRDTVRSVVEEVCRAERIDDPERIREELDVFNELIPAERELCATLFVEITDPAELATRLNALRGIEEAVHIEIGGVRIAQRHERGRSRDDRTGSVHYLRFALDDAQRAAFLDGASEIAVVADHPAYAVRAVLDERQRMALSADLVGR